MQMCKRGAGYVQVADENGTVIGCSWAKNNIFGNLNEKSLYEIYHGEAANNFRKKRLNGDYSDCSVDCCPYIANGTLQEEMIEEEQIPEYPDHISLSFEGKCNYKCTCCTSHNHMDKVLDCDNEKRIIEERIADVIPYAKTISAHGTGELFVSKRVMKVLGEWKPVCEKEDIEVLLETNGSLFDEHNWKQIEKLGNYKMHIAVTVMSFYEPVYQYLSGCKYPMEKIISNLHFMKSLREKNIINTFEIATVLQEQNFREMPEFTKRCIEEFGADIVRIRGILPGGRLDESDQWFMDVRNPKHPYYAEYIKVMKHKIFKHPKVMLWQGGADSNTREHPWKGNSSANEKKIIDILNKMIMLDDLSSKLNKYFNDNNCGRIGLYGMGNIGKALIKLLDEEVFAFDAIIDNNKVGAKNDDYEIKGASSKTMLELDTVVIASVYKKDEMIESIKNYNVKALYIGDVIEAISKC